MSVYLNTPENSFLLDIFNTYFNGNKDKKMYTQGKSRNQNTGQKRVVCMSKAIKAKRWIM